MMKPRLDLDHQFEFPEDKDFARKFFRGLWIAIAASAVIAIGLIRLCAYIAERWYE